MIIPVRSVGMNPIAAMTSNGVLVVNDHICCHVFHQVFFLVFHVTKRFVRCVGCHEWQVVVVSRETCCLHRQLLIKKMQTVTSVVANLALALT